MSNPAEMQIIEGARDELRRRGHEASIRRLSDYQKREGICLRLGTPRKGRAYMDGTVEMEVPYSIYVVRRSEEAAMGTCIDIAEHLQRHPLHGDGYGFGHQEITTHPHEFGYNDALRVWEAGMTAYITTRER